MTIESGNHINEGAELASFFYEEEKIKDFRNTDIISATQFDRENLPIIFQETDIAKEIVKQIGVTNTLKGKIIATLFYEQSTRTRLSMEAAALRLSANVISETNVQFSSAYKGEKLQDTIRVVANYCDLIALRHSEQGSAKKAVRVSSVPIINAGDGEGEHPTQALVDLYTIQDKFPKIDGTTITFLGDLRYGRTVHSLALLLSNYDVSINFVAPEFIQIPESIIKLLENKNIKTNKVNHLHQLETDFDIIYVTRLQEERFTDKHADLKLAHLRNSYNLDESFTKNSDAYIMHPLPRLNEIPTTLDEKEKAIYFEQSHNGMYVRMALLKLILQP